MQITVRLAPHVLRAVDDLVERGVYESRAAAVRAAISEVVEMDRRGQLDGAIVDGYRRIPPTTTEADAALESLRGAIVEEPW